MEETMKNPKESSFPLWSYIPIATPASGGSSIPDGTRLVSTGLENPSLQIVLVVLAGENYEWANAVHRALKGRGKLCYVDGKTTPPSSSDEAATQIWVAEDAIVSAWLINSMVPSLRRCFMYMSSAREIWDCVCEAYGARGNSSQIFNLKSKLWDLKQGNLCLGDYYLAKTTLWQELDLINDEVPCCNNHIAKYQKKVEKKRLFELLAGLNASFDAVRGHILMQEPLPSIREAFSILRNEDSRKTSMLKEEPVARMAINEPSALAARSFDKGKNKPICEHCKKVGHTKETCWDLHGKPHDWKPKRGKGRAYVAESAKENEITPSTPVPQGDKFDQILDMLTALQKQPAATVVKRGSVDGDDDWRC